MNYLNFAGWLLFMTWVISDIVPRYILPQLEHVYDTLDSLAEGAFCAKSLGRPLSLLIQVVVSISLAYLLTAWPVWCILRYFEHVRHIDDSWRVLYGITGFLCCLYALGKMASAHKYRGFFMSTFHYAVAMGAYIVFIINPRPIMEAYPWLVNMMGFQF